MDLHLICPSGANPRLQQLLNRVLDGRNVKVYRNAEDLRDLQNKKLLFALGLDETGLNFEYIKILARLRREPCHRDPGKFPHPGPEPANRPAGSLSGGGGGFDFPAL